MRITLPLAAAQPELRGTTPLQPVARLVWRPGQTLAATVLPSEPGDGGLVRLAVDGRSLTANWPGQPPAAGETLALKVLGQQQGVWQLEAAKLAEQPAIWLPQLLSDLGLPLSLDNLQILQSYLSGSWRGDLKQLATDRAGLCPLDRAAWQELFGCLPPALAPVLLALQPFPCALLVGERESRDQTTPAGEAERQLWFVLAADLQQLGPVRVVASGGWPRFDLTILAGEEALWNLRQTERELRQVLAATGLELLELTYRAVDRPILRLPAAEDLFLPGLDLKL